MWPYWLMFLLPAFTASFSTRVVTGPQRLGWWFILSLFALIIGFRHEVGGDWGAYLRHFDYVLYYDFGEVIRRSDPGYYTLSWLLADSGWSIYWLNFVCAIAAMAGVSIFARRQPLPWLALTAAVPYLLVVVAMGYTRQATALGFVLIGLAALGQHKTRQFVFWVIVGATFHKSAVLLLPIAALSATKNKFWTFTWVGVTALGAAYFFVVEEADALWTNYVEADYQSQGGLIRVAMNAVPSLLLLLTGDRLFFTVEERRLWRWMAIFSLLTVPLVTISSTAVDRVALYFIPIQLFTFSRFPFLMSGVSNRRLLTLAVVLYYGLVLYVWLNYAVNSGYWLPYSNYWLSF
ncbi:MAG: EpsG family protein [Halioglobus sp.]